MSFGGEVSLHAIDEAANVCGEGPSIGSCDGGGRKGDSASWPVER